jgi:hypothetical protein
MPQKPQTNGPACWFAGYSLHLLLLKNMATAMTGFLDWFKTSGQTRRRDGNTSTLIHSVPKSYSNPGFRQLPLKK